MRIELNPELNIFFGRNAQGKTNMLEAIAGLSDGRSFRSARIEDLIRHSESEAAVDGSVNSSEIETELQVRYGRNSRQYWVNGKQVHDVKDFAGRMKFVVFSAESLDIAYGDPNTRRDFLDRGIFSLYPAFLVLARTYRQILRQRNELLRKMDRDEAVLQTFTEKLVETGSRMIEYRIRFVSLLNETVPMLHRTVSCSDESIELSYRCSLGEAGHAHSEIANVFSSRLSQNFSDERFRGTTLIGPHRDDLDILINGNSIRNFGSRGQRRSCVMALKLAELQLIRQRTGDTPVLLLDDVASELDRERLVTFIGMIPGDVQVLMTLNAVDSAYFRSNMSLFSVNSGKIDCVSRDSVDYIQCKIQ